MLLGVNMCGGIDLRCRSIVWRSWCVVGGWCVLGGVLHKWGAMWNKMRMMHLCKTTKDLGV